MVSSSSDTQPQPVVIAPTWRNPKDPSRTSPFPEQDVQVGILTEAMSALGIESSYAFARALSVEDRPMVTKWMQLASRPRHARMSALYWARLVKLLLAQLNGDTAFVEAAKKRPMFLSYKEDE